MGFRQFAFQLAAALAIVSSAAIASAGGGPQNVAVVINASDPDSLAVANAYIDLRNIPPCNVIYSGWGANPLIHVENFRDRILVPALDELKKRGVADQIDCLTYSSGFPYMVDCSKMFAGAELPRAARPVTSLTSATYLYQYLLAERHEMFLGNVNLYYAPTQNGVTQSRSFSAQREWRPAGEAPGAPGLKYYLSTVLGVTHGRGNTPAEVIRSLQRAKEADGADYRGTIYYMRNNDVRSRTRQDGYQAAAAELKALGVNAAVENGVAPQNKSDVAGLTTGKGTVSLASSGSVLLPGALVDNLTSYGAKFVIAPDMDSQSRLSEFIRLGAAGASGTVVEPFAIAAKFPSPALHVHYARGCSLAESFYQAIAAPCHILVVGDPLCQPWAIPPKVTVEGLAPGTALKGTVALRPNAAFSDARKASQFQVFVNGVRAAILSPGDSFAWDTSQVTDGWHDLRFVAVDDTPIAVQGAWIGEVQVKNGRDAVQLRLSSPGSIAMGAPISISITSTLQAPANIFSNGRKLATVEAGTGSVSIDSSRLGIGRVELHAVQEGRPGVRSRPLAVEIQ